MARAGLVQISDATFEKEGKSIPYRKVALTRAAYKVDKSTPIEFIMKNSAPLSTRRRVKRKPTVSNKQGPRPNRSEAVGSGSPAERLANGASSHVEELLRAWRLEEARRRGVPAFRIFSDKALKAMAVRRPGTDRDLLAISGMGIGTVEKYGPQIYRILHGNKS